MLKETVIGISKAINGALGDSYKINQNKVEQGLKTPCFLITPLTVNQEHTVLKRYERKQAFMIQYFPKEKKYADEVADVIDTLMNCLEYITVDGALLQGTNMDAHVVDDVLNFSVNYDMFVFKQYSWNEEDSSVMEDLTIRLSVKDGE